MLYKQVLSEKQRLQSQIEQIKKRLSNLPKGNFFLVKEPTRTKWFYSLDGKRYYITKKQRHFAEQLALRRFLSAQLKDLERELAAIASYLKHYNLDTPNETEQLLTSPEYNELLSAHFKPMSQKLSEWASAFYVSNPNYPEDLKYKSPSGRMFRSKSEILIETLLLKNQIPFRYEAPLIIGEAIYYPDFTIRHPITGKLYYWEHCGMINKADYREKTFKKLQHYAEKNILPGVNLILTFESDNLPFDAEQVQKIIEQFFLQ